MTILTNSASLIFKQGNFQQKIGKLDIDVVTGKKVSKKVALTNNIIEGSFVTSNARKLPTEIRIDGLISEYSIKRSLLARLTSSNDISNILKDAHDELNRIIDAEEPITIVMNYKAYKNMIMTDFDMPSDPGDGVIFKFSAQFKEARIVSSQLVNVDNSVISKDSAKKKTSLGRKVGTEKVVAPPPPLDILQFFQDIF